MESVIITVCLLLLIAYVFDISSSKTKIPSVILLLILGWLVNNGFDFFHLTKPDFSKYLPIIGTIGLLLIVLDGALELELNKHKWKVVLKSFCIAFFPMLLLAIILVQVFNYYSDAGDQVKLINALPFCIVSSAIAIPSAIHLKPDSREFIIYESSISDILGVMFFNFLIQSDTIQSPEIIAFGGQFFLILILSFLAVLGLSFLLSRLKHQITYAPIILIIILFYAFSKLYHLPGLLFILIFGLFLGNLDELKQYSWIQKLNPDKLNAEIIKFKHITIELTFIVRAIFFIIFGFTIDLNDLINLKTLPIACLIVFSIYVIRIISLLLFRIPVMPILFFAPRGLITILLFLSIDSQLRIDIVNDSLVIQVVLLSVFILMIGNLVHKKIN
ncbi:MAG: cation:proton antiporter [Saprospiraceae bacterium]|nr:cation:proton antiporter [Saprospiraceae bacterium]